MTYTRAINSFVLQQYAAANKLLLNSDHARKMAIAHYKNYGSRLN